MASVRIFRQEKRKFRPEYRQVPRGNHQEVKNSRPPVVVSGGEKWKILRETAILGWGKFSPICRKEGRRGPSGRVCARKNNSREEEIFRAAVSSVIISALFSALIVKFEVP